MIINYGAGNITPVGSTLRCMENVNPKKIGEIPIIRLKNVLNAKVGSPLQQYLKQRKRELSRGKLNTEVKKDSFLRKKA